LLKTVVRYSFGPFSLDPEARVLLRDDEPIPMAGKTFDTLLVLVQNRGRLVDKDELLSRVWPDRVVEEANLSQNIFTVRKILGDSPKDHRYIATVAGRGYQFVAPVADLPTDPLPAPAAKEKAQPKVPKKGMCCEYR
jgi:DNA-binding winged helix-turn-helix (wHTH) protein